MIEFVYKEKAKETGPERKLESAEECPADWRAGRKPENLYRGLCDYISETVLRKKKR